MDQIAPGLFAEYENTESEDKSFLREDSPRDKPWDRHRANADAVARIYAEGAEFERYAQRMGECSGVLRFGETVDPETGEIRLRLREASFCRVRHCPVCQWRRTLMWLARFLQALPEIEAEQPKARWLFLTVTVRNCDVTDLRQTLGYMNKAWQRLKDRKEFRHVQGWVRTTEVTRSKDGKAHPHFHALLMVRPSYFKGENYVSQAKWSEAWQGAARLDYAPIVDVRAVKGKASGRDALKDAVRETLKYAVKPADAVSDPDWFRELTRQVHKLRFLASGGVLKDVLRQDQETQGELILGEESGTGPDDGSRKAYRWERPEQVYRRYVKADKPPDHDPRQIDLEEAIEAVRRRDG